MLKIELPYYLAVLLLGIYPKEMKTLIQKDVCIPRFIAALLIITKIWKEPKCPSIDDWVKKLFYIYMYIGFPGGSDSKEFACGAGELGLIPGLRTSPWRRERLPTPVSLPGKFHGERSLVGYSPWDPKELDTTEWLTLSFFIISFFDI